MTVPTRRKILTLIAVMTTLAVVAAPATGRIAGARFGHLDTLAIKTLGNSYGCLVNPDAPDDRGRGVLNVTSPAALAPAWKLVKRADLEARATLAVVAPRYARAALLKTMDRFEPPNDGTGLRIRLGTNARTCQIKLWVLPSATTETRDWATAQQVRLGERIRVIVVKPGEAFPASRDSVN